MYARGAPQSKGVGGPALVSTACVFLPAGSVRHGRHTPDEESAGRCFCYALYGEPKPWGCRWFNLWRKQVDQAQKMGLKLMVVHKNGGEEFCDKANPEKTFVWGQLPQ